MDVDDWVDDDFVSPKQRDQGVMPVGSQLSKGVGRKKTKRGNRASRKVNNGIKGRRLRRLL